MILAGLLAWLATDNLPIPKEQWYEASADQKANVAGGRDFAYLPYSYGDSAGFTPDFPFNPHILARMCRNQNRDKSNDEKPGWQISLCSPRGKPFSGDSKDGGKFGRAGLF
jgi:hypothetical protein